MQRQSGAFPSTLYAVTKAHGKLKRKTLHFKGLHKNRGYYASKDAHLFFADTWFCGASFVISKLGPLATKESNIVATTPEDPSTPQFPPTKGWQSDRFDEVTVSINKPADWIEGESVESKEKVAKLLAKMKKADVNEDGNFELTVRDICQHIEAVKEHLPELLTEFARIDQDGNGKVTLQEIDDYFNPMKKKELDREQLDEYWNILVSKRTGADGDLPKDVLFLEDMAANIDFVEEKMPELVECFADIDTDKSCTVSKTEFDAFFGSADLWLEAKMASIIGLGELKNQIKTFYWQMRLDRLRRRGGVMVNNDEAIVIMFKGSPGTGKTTIGRLITGLLHKIDIIPTDTFVECQRDELVGDHIGATEKQTQKKIDEASGGVLFVDEAYRLNADIFGVEAINSLMKAMTIKGTVMILAGYPKQMDEFVTANPGLKRRITYEMTFPDYSNDDLARILFTQVARRGFKVDESSCSLQATSSLIGGCTNEKQRECFNGGIGEHITRHAIFHLNETEQKRVVGCKKGEEPTPSIVLTMDDLKAGSKHVPDPPPADTIQFKTPAGGRAAPA